MNIRVRKTAYFSITAALFLSACATEPSLYTGDTAYYGYTWQQELELGKKTDVDIVKQMGLYPNDAIAKYVSNIGQELLSHSAMKAPDAPVLYRNTEFTFRVLDSPVVNAFALPGGYVYITRGLLAHVQNEAQLAVVIGHEITHVEARHASKQALKQQWGQVGLLAGAIIGEQIAKDKEFASQALNAGGTLFQLATLKYGRDAERESDQHGVEYAAKAGYETSEGSAFFNSLKRISEKSGQSIPSWMSSHPDPGEREVTVKRLSQQWNPDGQQRFTGSREFLNTINGLIVGENPRNGYTENEFFRHPNLRLQFQTPSGWQVRNESDAVYIQEPNGTAIIIFNATTEKTAVDAARALQQRLNVQATFAQESRINELPAYTMKGTALNGSETVPLRITAIEYNGSVFSFLGYGSSTGYETHRKSIAKVAASFQELNNQQALNVQPYRIEIKVAERTTPFRDFIPSNLPVGTDAQDWAIMNQVDLDQTIERGRLLKLPARQN